MQRGLVTNYCKVIGRAQIHGVQMVQMFLGFLSHGSNATVGNYTQMIFGGSLSAVHRNFSGTMGFTFTFNETI